MNNDISINKLLVIGWDAADWNCIDPLLRTGAMPNLQRLLASGVRGNLKSIEPKLSPILWTSIATGKVAEKHGILNFVEPRPDGEGIRVSQSTSRKTKAVWNILSQQQRVTNVIGWYASHPAEPINGRIVSNLLHEGFVIQSGQNTGTITVKTGTTSGAITVKSVSSCGNSSAFSLTVTIGTCTTARTTESGSFSPDDEVFLDVTFYPNPTSDVIHFVATSEAPQSIEVYNMVGQQVMKLGWQNEVSLESLTNGTYFIRFVFQDTYITKKVVVGSLR